MYSWGHFHIIQASMNVLLASGSPVNVNTSNSEATGTGELGVAGDIYGYIESQS